MSSVAQDTLIPKQIRLRPPQQVMNLKRMGSAFPSRISFMRNLIRRMHNEKWVVHKSRFELDDHGYGHAVYEARTPTRVYSLVAFATPLADDQRTDRVIAEAWDTTYTLYDGEVSSEEIQRLKANTTRQEAGRFDSKDLVLSRANKSVRLYEYVCDCLARGEQPKRETLGEVGYLMRTTAVYGNGKFGISDRNQIADRSELSGPFQAEMLTVYLIRCFTHDHIEHLARCRGRDSFVPLDKSLRRILGIGNATGLGMAPFLVTHPALIHHWMYAKERAFARVRAVPRASTDNLNRLKELMDRVHIHINEWNVADSIQNERIKILRQEYQHLRQSMDNQFLKQITYPWENLYQCTEQYSLETQELLVSTLMELHPELVDELEAELSTSYQEKLEPNWSVGELKTFIQERYQWACDIDFDNQDHRALFWYTSEDKLEPRLGWRFEEPGADSEMPLAIARDIHLLNQDLENITNDVSIAELAIRHPEWRHVLTRIQTIRSHPYGEIYDNVIDKTCRPIDLLRCKLAFFGASKFDPKSDRWTRITLYQGAPLPDELPLPNADDWCFATLG